MSASPNKARDIFVAAVKLAPEQWDAYLTEACGGNEALRDRVRNLLASHKEAGSFLEPAVAGSTVTTDAQILERPGTVIGPYKLLQQIGEGGMGTVFMAEQTHPIQRKVAVKIIKAGMDSGQVIARFEVERQALAMMDHVNIARVLDAGATDAGLPFFVMELVHGVPITKYCDDNHLTPRQRLELFVPVCQAIQHAHQKGIIHRDIKPSNVMITLYDGKPVPKVIDFGVAKATEQKLTERTLFTTYGTMVGTLEYMSPEQAEMSALGADTRSDIFSLGVLLYELLTGSTPLSHKRLKEAAYGEVLRMIREEEAPKPSTRLGESGAALASISANRHMEPAKLTKLMRGELDWIVMKTLEKDRNRRYETANAFAADVQRYLADEPVQACPPSAWYRVRKFARRNKTVLVMASVIGVALLLAVGSFGWAVRDRVARQAESEQAETARQATVAGQVRDSLNTARTFIAENKLASAREKLAQARAQLGNDGPALGNLAVEVEAGEAALDRFQQFVDLIDRAHEAETTPLLEPTLVADGSQGSAATPAPAGTAGRRPAAAVPFLLEALRRYDVLERDEWNSTLGSDLLGRHQVEQIRHLAYEELLWLADDVVRRQQEHRSERTLSPEAAARQALVYLGKAESAQRPTPALYALRARCRKALGEEAAAQADTQLADKTPATMALDHFLRGQAAYDAKQLAEGLKEFEAALRVESTHYWSMMWLGHCLNDLGQGPEDFAAAVRVFTGCILKRPGHAHAFSSRASASFRLGRYEEALADHSRAIALDPKFALARYNRGIAYYNLGKLDKALADYSRAIELDPKHARAWNNRGATYIKLGQPDKALPDFGRAIDLDPKYAHARNNRGVAYTKLGQLDKAVADYSRAIELYPKYALAWLNRGNAYTKLRRPDEALADYSRAIELYPKYALAWLNRGNTYTDLHQLDKALLDYSRAIELNPQDARAWFNRGMAYAKLDQQEKALADYSKAIELDPKDALAWHNRGTTYSKLAQLDKALPDYSKAIELDPKDARAWHNRGMAYTKLGQQEKAISDFSKAIELNTKYALAHFNRGIVHDKLGQLDKAVADFSRAIELNPTLALARFNRAVVHDKLGQLDKAVADFSRTIELTPKYARAWGGRGSLHFTLGQLDTALADYSKAIELDPKYALAWDGRGVVYLKLGQAEKAVADSSKATELAPKVGSYWKTLGVAHYRAGAWKAAVAALDKSLELGQGGDAGAWFFLAMAHRKLANLDEARKAYEQAVQWLEKNQEALEKDKGLAEELRRFRAEAEEVLELMKK